MMKKICYTFLPMICLLFSCASDSKTPITSEQAVETSADPSSSKALSTSSKIESLSAGYPAAYKEMNLPVWEKATVEQANKIKNDRGTRYQMSLATKENLHTTAKYYSKALTEAGWKIQNSGAKVQQADKRSLRFTKGSQQSMVNIIDLPDMKKRVITIVFSVKE